MFDKRRRYLESIGHPVQAFGRMPDFARETYLEDLDTLRHEKLPPTADLNTRYRPLVPNITIASGYVLSLLLSISVIFIFVTLYFHVFGYLMSTPIAASLLISCALIAAVFNLVARESRATVFTLGLSGIAFWLLFITLQLPNWALTILFTCALLAVVFFARSVAFEYIRWLAANPAANPDARARYQNMQKSDLRFSAGHLTILVGAIVVAIGLLLSRAFAWLAPYESYLPGKLSAAALSAVFVFFVCNLLAAWFNRRTLRGLQRSSSEPSPRASTWPLFWRALIHWLTYSPHPFAAGVHRTVATRRKLILWCVFPALILTLLPISAYFPLTILLDTDPWIAATWVPEELRPAPPGSPGHHVEDRMYTFPLANSEKLVDVYSQLRSDLSDQDPRALEENLDAFFFVLPISYWKHTEELEKHLGEQDSRVFDRTLASLVYIERIEREQRWLYRLALQEHVHSSDIYFQQHPPEAYEPYLDPAPRGAPSSLTSAQFLPRTADSNDWMRLARNGLATEHNAFFVWSWFAAFFACLLIPVALFLSVCHLASTPFLLAPYHELVECDDVGRPSDWEHYVEALQASNNPTERQSLWMGVHEYGDYPVMMPVSVLREHAHILGDTGSGKSALGLAPMIAQLIRLSARDAASADAEDQPCSVLVIDLKGDNALFQGALQETLRANEKTGANLEFKWFTNQLDHSTYVFNPFAQAHFRDLSPNQRAEVFLESLSLAYKGEYGPSYYAGMNRQVLSRAFNTFGDSIQSFAELNEYFKEQNRDLGGKKFRLKQQERQDAAHLLNTVDALAKIPALNLSANCTTSKREEKSVAHQIDVEDILTRPQVIYFYLPAAIEATTIADIGKLALFSLLSGASALKSRGVKTLQTYVFIDEFQQVVAENLELVFRQARSHGVACILANQTISDLETSAVDIVPTVRANTRFKQFFASTDLKQQADLVTASGETVRYMMHSIKGGADPEHDSESLSTQIAPRITANDVIRMTDDGTLTIAQLSRGAGFSQFGGFPFELRTAFHISEDEYKRRERQAWPADNGNTITPGLPGEQATKSKQHANSDAQPEVKAAKANKAKSVVDSLDSLSRSQHDS